MGMQNIASQVAALTQRLNATEIRNEERSSKLPIDKGNVAQGSGVKLVTKTSQVPVRGTTESAGFDVKADEEVTIPVGCRRAVRIGMTLFPQVGHYMHVLPRSGLALKHGIVIGAGVVDRGYRGNVR